MPGETVHQSPDSRRRTMQETRNEKRLIDVKVASVREVVKNASNNDIILALHNFDMDVPRTIQAFCEDGAQSALDAWMTDTARTSKNKKRRNKKKGQLLTVDSNDGTASESMSTASPCPPPYLHSDTPSSPPGSLTNGDLGSELTIAALTNGVVLNNNNNNNIGLSTAHFPVSDPLPPRSQNKRSEMNKTSSRGNYNPPKGEKPNQTSVAPTLLPTQPDVANRPTNFQDKRKAVAKETKNLFRHDAVTERVHARFSEEVERARDRMRRAFQEMRILLNDREEHLIAELERCKEEGHKVLKERATHGHELHVRSDRVSAMSDKELTELKNEIKRFTSERKYEEDLGETLRFQWEPDRLIEMIKNFGEVVPIKPFLAHKHSSHSSLVSSVGEDSGLGMISPVSPEDKKPVAQIQSGGISMKSESLTTEQLEELNRRLQESLQMQGITPDIIQGVGGISMMPARRRQPPTSGRGGRGRGRGYERNGPNRASGQPNLSILDK